MNGVPHEWCYDLSVDYISLDDSQFIVAVSKILKSGKSNTEIACEISELGVKRFAYQRAIKTFQINNTVYCSCGCGKLTPIAPRTRKRSGWVKGNPMSRIPGHRIPFPVRDNVTGCLLWRGYIDPKNGYPRIGNKWAHRVWYERNVGSIPDGFEVDHLCFNTICVEPSHLEAVPSVVNRSRVRKKETCSKGHLLHGENLAPSVTRPNARICIICRRERDAIRRRNSRLKGR